MQIKDTVSKIFKKYISDKIPRNQTNVFWMMFNGIDSMFAHLETLLRINKRERNIMTAQSLNSLRTISAENGYEPVLKIPSSGIISIKCSQKLFSEVGYPLYLPPYSVFKNKISGMLYYYDSQSVLKLDNSVKHVPLVEGEIITAKHTSLGNVIERFYIVNDTLAANSLSIKGYVEVKSFVDNENLNNDKQFIIKYSNKPNSPIVVYIKGTTLNEILDIVYRITFGASGNIDYNATFETDSILDSFGNHIEVSDSDITIKNIGGFAFGSNGSDINTLKASVGFNHGVSLLFDNSSYRSFIYKYSTLLLQKIELSGENKSINNIYLSKKVFLIEDNVVTEYPKNISLQTYKLPKSELVTLSKLISDNEFATSSHNLYDSDICKFAFQIQFNDELSLNINKEKIQKLIYWQFSKFLYDTNYQVNFEVLFNNYMEENNTIFEYVIFNSVIEQDKIINNNNNVNTPYIIKHENYLPILRGNFKISADIITTLFSDINFVIK